MPSRGLELTTEQRFWIKVRTGGPDECWPWLGAKTGGGYGCFGFRGRIEQAPRVAWILTNGEIPVLPDADYRGTCVCHSCDNRACVNPAHLFLGTHADNVADRHRKGRDANPPRGEQQHLSKLTADNVIAIRALAAAGLSRRKLARQFGVSKPTIQSAVKRKTWKHVPAQALPASEAVHA